MQGVYRANEIDAIAAYCAALNRCYLIPFEFCPPSGTLNLRLGASRNNQRIGINWASDYELGAIAQLGERSAGSRKVVGSSPTSST